MANTKQIIRIELTSSNYATIRLSALIGWIAALSGIEIKRLEVKELKK